MNTADHDDVVRRSFEQQVGLFTGENALFARRAASALAWLEPLDPDMIVLDVACGAAHATEAAAPSVRQVVGIDLTGALLALGAERLRSAGITNVLLQEGSATALPFVDASFDLVVCRSSVHHFEEPERAIAEMARVCRAGGRVVISDMIAPAAEQRDAFDELHRCIDPSHVHALLEAELAEMLERGVGPLTYGETTTIAFPVDAMLTDAADREAALAALRAELDGGRPTGFDPTCTDGRIAVSFTLTVAHATRE
jgi:ubiquinone/menaquinone biosynthesis C-methylase UbiE